MSDLSVLVVDDDPKIRKLVRVNLEKRGYKVKELANGASAIEQIQQEQPDLMVIDLVMPGMSGNDVTEWVRERWDIPIIVMSAHHEEELKVRALDAGADDFVTKPFGQEEFMARIRAVMRRANWTEEPAAVETVVQVNNLKINLKARRSFVNDLDMRLTRTEFSLLAELAQNLDAVLSHDELLARVWGVEYRGSSHYLHVYFGRIRKKMGDEHSNYLETVPGVGYILHSTPQYIATQ